LPVIECYFNSQEFQVAGALLYRKCYSASVLLKRF